MLSRNAYSGETDEKRKQTPQSQRQQYQFYSSRKLKASKRKAKTKEVRAELYKRRLFPQNESKENNNTSAEPRILHKKQPCWWRNGQRKLCELGKLFAAFLLLCVNKHFKGTITFYFTSFLIQSVISSPQNCLDTELPIWVSYDNLFKIMGALQHCKSGWYNILTCFLLHFDGSLVPIFECCYLYSVIKRIPEAFQGVEATGDMAPKAGDNLLPKYRQPTEIGRKRATVCDSDNSLSIPLCFLCDSDICP